MKRLLCLVVVFALYGCQELPYKKDCRARFKSFTWEMYECMKAGQKAHEQELKDEANNRDMARKKAEEEKLMTEVQAYSRACKQYGYAEGSDSFAQCVQKELERHALAVKCREQSTALSLALCKFSCSATQTTTMNEIANCQAKCTEAWGPSPECR